MIPFNKPVSIGKELDYIRQSVESGKISGDGLFTKKCQHFFTEKYGYTKTLLTHSCTAALEMAALLINTNADDEIIMPSFTFVSTANAFVLRGAKIVFADSSEHHPNIDVAKIEPLITPKTKAIVIVHYAGIACDMNPIMQLAYKYNLYVIEDAAQAIDSTYYGKPIGGMGHLAAFSFHETKNIISGEGGMIVINDDKFNSRAEIIREKGTNRSAFFRGDVEKYNWIDIGSSFLPSDIIAAYLYAQLKQMDIILEKRKLLWDYYYSSLKPIEEAHYIKLPCIPQFASNNAHIFYILCRNNDERNKLLEYLNKNNIMAVFHYLPLHQSPYYKNKHDGRNLPNAVYYSDCLIRLPLFYELSVTEINIIVSCIHHFFI